MRTTLLWLSMAACFAANCAAADDKKPKAVPALLFGVESSTPVREVAVIYLNQSHAKNAKTRIGAIFPLAEGKSFDRNYQEGREEVTKVGQAYIKPGRYHFSGYCVTALRDVVVGTPLTLEAGKTYHVRCTGRTPRTMRYEAFELPSAP